MKKLVYLFAAFLLSCTTDSNQAEKLLQHFIDGHVEKIRDINYKLNLSTYEAHSGKKEFKILSETFANLQDSINHPEFLAPDYQALLQSVYHNENEFQFLKRFKESDLIQDPLLQRQLYSLYRNYFWTVNNFDALTKNQEILFDQFIQLQIYRNQLSSKNNQEIENHIQKHYALENDFRALLNQRNKDMQRLLDMDYYDYLLELIGISDEHQLNLINEIEKITHDDYLKLYSLMQSNGNDASARNDSQLTYSNANCCRYNMTFPEKWHKEFSQEKLLSILTGFYDSFNLSVHDVLENSDIWYDDSKPANVEFFIAIDPETDLRLFANLKPNTYAALILLHEMAHAAHQKYVAHDIPYLVKEPNIILTEGVAMFFDNQLYWNTELQEKLELPSQAPNVFYEHFRNPAFLYMLRSLAWRADFERQMFKNPNQDLTNLWWDLAEKYLFIKIPKEERKPDWTFNRHIILSGGMYQVYLNAIVISAQLQVQLDKNPETIAEIKSRLFQYGNAIDWQSLFKQAYDQPIDPLYLPKAYRKRDDLIARKATPAVLSN